MSTTSGKRIVEADPQYFRPKFGNEESIKLGSKSRTANMPRKKRGLSQIFIGERIARHVASAPEVMLLYKNTNPYWNGNSFWKSMPVAGQKQQNLKVEIGEMTKIVSSLIEYREIKDIPNLWRYSLEVSSQNDPENKALLSLIMTLYKEIGKNQGYNIAKLCINRVLVINLVLDPCNPRIRLIAYILNQRLEFIDNWQDFDD